MANVLQRGKDPIKDEARPRTAGRVTGLLGRLGIDPYLLAILGTVGFAVLLPARGAAASGLSTATAVLIGLLFFLYGARLSPGTPSRVRPTGSSI